MNIIPFSTAVKENNIVKLLNVYQGVPVVYDAEVLEIKEGFVRLKVHPLQLVCLRLNKNTHISFSNMTYKAIVSSVDIENEMVLLSNIEPCHDFGKRKFVRVKPSGPTDVDVFVIKTVNTDMGKWLNSTMLDISIRGLAVKMDKFMTGLTKLEVNNLLKLNFYLPSFGEGGDFRMYLDGVVRGIRDIKGTNDVRIGISTSPGNEAEGFLTRYVSQRQNDILKSLKQAREQTESLNNVV